MSSLDYLDLCRLCLVKDRVSVPIFEGEGNDLFLKIAACLPVKVAREDKLPKKICDDCVYKIELFYEFWNTTANAEKRLLQWLGEVSVEGGKQGYVSNVLNPNVMKQEQSTENRLDGGVMQQVGEHQNNMSMSMMDNMGLGIPMMISTTNQQQQQITSVPMDTSGSSVQNVQAVPGPSSQATHNQISQNQTGSTQQEVEEESSEDEENSDDECDVDEEYFAHTVGLPVKEESEEDPNSRTIEPTTFVNVSLACDEAGPSGLQQQKITDLPEMSIPQPADGDPKTGYFVSKLAMLPQDQEHCEVTEIFEREETTGQLLIADRVPKVEDDEIIITENIVQCSLCGDSFVSEQALRMHLEMHEHGNVQLSDDHLVCELCGCSCESSAALEEHQLEHETDEVHSGSLVIKHEESNDFKYRCEICSTSFFSYNSYQEHQINQHSHDKPFQCEVCNATFRYRQGLRLHTKLHQPGYVPPQRKHHCELCNKRFSRRQVLLVHMRTHGNVGPQNEFTCPVCGKSVSSKTYLTVHLRKHTGEKPHVCDHCGKGFTAQNYLSVHRRTHTGERPHKCTHCDKRFTQRSTLVVHLRGHTGDRPYPCPTCHKSFASKTMLNSHLKTHAKQNARQQQEHEQEQEQQQQLQLQQEQVVQEMDQSLDTVTILLPS
ncbi:uncharacterized protein LOC143363861 isoform X11 [Halictus rubicundus]|uniref:uncharacterized protein LOC143363861 isoform X11 n=1 Tax=Halictus rubicundus TaxID=77578 RepID=UPI004035BA4A